MAGWQGGQGLTWVQRRLLWGYLVTVQLILTLKQTQPDFYLTTRCRPAATAQALILLGAELYPAQASPHLLITLCGEHQG